MSEITITRLHTAIAAAAPIHGVCILDHDSRQVRIDYVDSATEADKVNGDAALAAFDWDDSLDDNFLAQVSTDAAQASIDSGITIKGAALDRLMVAQSLVAIDAINVDRAAFTAMNNAVQAATSLADLKTKFAAINFPNQVTPAQALNAVKSKLGTLPK